jgi:hypothetical protein
VLDDLLRLQLKEIIGTPPFFQRARFVAHVQEGVKEIPALVAFASSEMARSQRPPAQLFSDPESMKPQRLVLFREECNSCLLTPLQEQCDCYMGVDTIVTLAKRASALSAYVEVLNLGKRARALSRSIF